MITYRDPTPADLPAIDALFCRSFADTFAHLYAPADLAAFFAKFTPQAWADELATLRFRLAERDGHLVGYAKIGPLSLPVDPDGAAMELRQLYLLDAAKGTGAADALTDWAIHAARASGAGALYLSVYVDNYRAKRFYARRGFEDIGPYIFMVGEHADEDRLMRLDL
jgi:ribosomal protein S18 acetylase RimI-like enzyme